MQALLIPCRLLMRPRHSIAVVEGEAYAGSDLHRTHRCLVRSDPRADRGVVPSRENRMTFVQFAMWIAGALAAYLIYALLKAEKF
jgi:K+-transporting ATPase KdpF subunit